MIPTLAPSDLVTEPQLGQVQIGGRVAQLGPDYFVLADALGVLRVDGSPGAVSPGDLLSCVVETTGDSCRLVKVLSANPAPEPRGDGEFSRLGSTGRGQALQARSRALAAVRAYFQAENFIEAETPTFVPSPGLDPHVDSLAQVVRGTRTDHLITSPEFHMKRLLVGGLPRIYQVARCFRAEEIGTWHEPEFTLVEWYRAFSGFEEIIRDTEELVRAVMETIGVPGVIPVGPFLRLTIREAFKRFAGISDAVHLAEAAPDDYFQALVDFVEPGLSRLDAPVFLTDYPLPMAALARLSPSDPTVAERFELYFRGVELCNGYGELTDAEVQRSRFEQERTRRAQAGAPQYPLDEQLLAALVEGMPPSAGNALGLDRLIALALDAPGIAPTLAFSDAER